MICACCQQETPEGPACARCGEPPLAGGRYRLEVIVGRGALGTVYRARDLEDGGLVALKVIPLLHDEGSKRAELITREIEVLKQLVHPQIAGYRDHLIAEVGPSRVIYLALEFIDGETLAQEAERVRYTVDGVLEILEELLELLTYLQALSPPIIHRDLKPGNVMRRSDDGRLVLVDFGSVRDTLRDPKLGGSTVTGSFGYMAPEQFAGEAGVETDIYGLGALAVALLSRREPSTMMGSGWGLAWREHVKVSPPVEALLKRMLEPDRALRASNAERLRVDIQQIRAGVKTHPHMPALKIAPPAPPEPSRGWRRLKRGAQALALLVGLTTAWVWWPTLTAGWIEGPTLEQIRAEALDDIERLKLLAAIDPRRLKEMKQWMYLVYVHDADGNEDDIARFITRFERELEDPIVIKAELFESLLAEMKRKASLPETRRRRGYDRVKEIITPTLAALPSSKASLEKILMMEDDRVVGAFLVNEYLRGEHYHRYWSHRAILDALAKGQRYRPVNLAVFEQVLRDESPWFYHDSTYLRAVKAARPVVGERFDEWYEDVTGNAYRWDWLAHKVFFW